MWKLVIAAWQILNQLSVCTIKEKKITEKKTQVVHCNCKNKPDCSLSNQCQILNIIYRVKITSNSENYHGKRYYGTRDGTFKQRYGNHRFHELIRFFGSRWGTKHNMDGVYFLKKYDGLSKLVAFKQNWDILQTRMEQRGDPMKINFDHFQT